MFIESFIIWPALVAAYVAADHSSQQGNCSFQTVPISGLTTDSATTLTMTGSSSTITTAVPVWHCTANCSGDNYGIIAIPGAVTGASGNLSPPPNYPPLSLGSNGLPTPVSGMNHSTATGRFTLFANTSIPATVTLTAGPKIHVTAMSSIPDSIYRSWALSFSGSPSASALLSVQSFSNGTGKYPVNSFQSFIGETAALSISLTPGGVMIPGTRAPAIQADTFAPISITSGYIILSSTSSSSFAPNNASLLPASASTRESLRYSGGSSLSGFSSVSSNASVVPVLGPSVAASVIITSGSAGAITTIVPVIIGSDVTSPRPVIMTQSMDPTGTDLKLSAQSLQTQIIYATRAVQSWTINPSNSASKTEAINAVKSAELLGEDIFARFRGGGGGDVLPCNSGGSFLEKLVSAISCAITGLSKLGSDIKGNVDRIEGDLKGLGAFVQPLNPADPVPDPSPSISDPSSKVISSTTSSAACTITTVASRCDVNCVAGSVTSSCTSTCSSITAGCNPTGTTVTTTRAAEASRTQYVIFASMNADAKSISNELDSKVEDPETILFSSPDEDIGLFAFWAIPQDSKSSSSAGLNQSQVDEVQKLPGVSLIVPNTAFDHDTDLLSISNVLTATPTSDITLTVVTVAAESKGSMLPRKEQRWKYPTRGGASLTTDSSRRQLERRVNELSVSQQVRKNPPDPNSLDVPYELRAVSQPYGQVPLPDLSTLDYVYRAPAGINTWVYVLDSGVTRDHQDFQRGCNIVPDDEWIMVLGATSAHDDPDGHGTAVISKVCGKIAGITKETTIIPVKFNSANILSLTSMWSKVLKDVRRRQTGYPPTALPGKTVINFSNRVEVTLDLPALSQLKLVLKRLMDLGVVIVASAGNDALEYGSPAITGYPQLWASNEFPIIVVSSVDRTFAPSPFSQYGEQTCVWAIGSENVCAVSNSPNGYLPFSGTSFAAPQVAGLVAYFLSLPDAETPFGTAKDQVALNAYQYFKTGAGAYSRFSGGQRVIYNLLDGSTAARCAAAPFRKPKQKRDDGSVCTLSLRKPPSSAADLPPPLPKPSPFFSTATPLPSSATSSGPPSSISLRSWSETSSTSSSSSLTTLLISSLPAGPSVTTSITTTSSAPAPSCTPGSFTQEADCTRECKGGGRCKSGVEYLQPGGMDPRFFSKCICH